MSQLHIDNHYVPQLYLKQWAINGRIPTYSLLVAHHNAPLWKSRSPKGLAYHRNLYTNIVNGAENDELERWLDSEFEAPAERPLALATHDCRLEPDDWHKLVRFAVAQDVRTPARLREFMRRQAEQLPAMLDSAVKRVADKLISEDAAVHSVHGIEATGFPLKVSIEASEDQESGILRAEAIIGRSLWHWSIRRLLTGTIAKVPARGWSIVKPARGYLWPSSDSPLIRLNYWNENNYNFEGGWNAPLGDVLLPLSPTHLLHRCAGVRPKTPGTRLEVATTRQIIRIIIEHADRYVFAQQEFDIESIRKRAVDAQLLKEERMAWESWNSDQAQAEHGYSFG